MDICGYTDTEKTIVHETDGRNVDGGTQPGSSGLVPVVAAAEPSGR